MKVKAMCIDDRVENYVGKKGAHSSRMLTLMDMDVGMLFNQTFDYRMSNAEIARFSCSANKVTQS